MNEKSIELLLIMFLFYHKAKNRRAMDGISKNSFSQIIKIFSDR